MRATRPIGEQVVLVTGATDGLGRGLAERLAGLGAEVVVHGRNPAKLDATRRAIEAAHPGARLRPMVADLASLGEVEALTRRVLAEVPVLHALVNNAGVGFGADAGLREESRDGIELRFAVNHLAAYHLARRLAPPARPLGPRPDHPGGIGRPGATGS